MTLLLAGLATAAVGALIAVVVVARRAADREAEITRLRREQAEQLAEAQVATESIGRLQTALDTIPQGVCLADERGEVVFRNHAARDF